MYRKINDAELSSLNFSIKEWDLAPSRSGFLGLKFRIIITCAQVVFKDGWRKTKKKKKKKMMMMTMMKKKKKGGGVLQDKNSTVPSQNKN